MKCIPHGPPLVNLGPGGILFEEAEGAFPLVEGYAALVHVEVTKHAIEYFETVAFVGSLERDAGGRRTSGQLPDLRNRVELVPSGFRDAQ